jgi:hypothetical protein
VLTPYISIGALDLDKECDTIENMPHWQECAHMAEHIYVLVDNDHI